DNTTDSARTHGFLLNEGDTETVLTSASCASFIVHSPLLRSNGRLMRVRRLIAATLSSTPIALSLATRAAVRRRQSEYRGKPGLLAISLSCGAVGAILPVCRRFAGAVGCAWLRSLRRRSQSTRILRAVRYSFGRKPQVLLLIRAHIDIVGKI